MKSEAAGQGAEAAALFLGWESKGVLRALTQGASSCPAGCCDVWFFSAEEKAALGRGENNSLNQ